MDDSAGEVALAQFHDIKDDDLQLLDETALEEAYHNILLKDLREKTLWRIGSKLPHPWLGFKTTDPNQHIKQNHRYIVHAIRMYDHKNVGESINKFMAKPAISTSLIFNGHNETFYKVGLILDVPSENIVAARPCGISGAILNGDSTEADFRAAVQEADNAWGVMPPQHIMAFAKIVRSLNEVYAITGFRYSAKSPIKIIGIFVDKSGHELPEHFANNLESILHVPIVRI
jgi:hypothetical protein